jgi:hypothetical protein
LTLAAIGFFLVSLAALLVVAFFSYVFGQSFSIHTDNITAPLLLATNLGLAGCVPLSMLLARLVYGTRPRWLASTAPGIRWRWLLSCYGMASAVWGVLFVLLMLAILATGKGVLDGHAIAILVVVFTTTPLQAAGEEYLFRGFLMQSLGATRLAAPVCWVVSGALFATAHGQFQPPLFADRLLLGIVFCWLATTTGGLEATIAIHGVKNVSVFIPAALLQQVSGAIDPKDVTWAPFALDAVMLAGVAAWILARSRRANGAAPPGPPYRAQSEPAPPPTSL